MNSRWIFSPSKGIYVMIILWAVSLAASPLSAGVVTLKNGDRVTGTLVSVKGGTLELKSDILGDLHIPLAKIETFTSEKDAVVVVKGQSPLQGKLEFGSSGKWLVVGNGKSQEVSADQASLILPAGSYHALMEHHAEPWQDWKGTASLGYSIQRGDQQTNSFTTSVLAVRERPAPPVFRAHWRTNFSLTTLISHDSQAGVSVTSNTLSTSLRQDYLFSASNFVFALAQIDHVGALGLYLRQTYGGGAGHDVVKNARVSFSLLAGATFVHEKFFTGVFDQNAAAYAGERFGLQIAKAVRLDHMFNIYPDLTDSGQYRLDTSTTLSAKINSRFSLNTGIIDLYLSNPPAGSHNNNFAFTTGLGFTF